MLTLAQLRTLTLPSLRNGPLPLPQAGEGILPRAEIKVFWFFSSGKNIRNCSPPWRALEATELTALSGQVPDFGTPRPTAKSLFASFSSEKEESCSFLKKRTKRLLLPDAGSKIRDLAGKYGVHQEDDDWEGG
jgi:hypothetical protein